MSLMTSDLNSNIKHKFADSKNRQTTGWRGYFAIAKALTVSIGFPWKQEQNGKYCKV